MSDSSVIVLGLAVGLMVGIIGAGVRAVLLAVSRRGTTDFWNINNRD